MPTVRLDGRKTWRAVMVSKSAALDPKHLFSPQIMMAVILLLPLVDKLSKSTHNIFFPSSLFASCHVDGFDLIGSCFEISASTSTQPYPGTTSSCSGSVWTVTVNKLIISRQFNIQSRYSYLKRCVAVFFFFFVLRKQQMPPRQWTKQAAVSFFLADEPMDALTHGSISKSHW